MAGRKNTRAIVKSRLDIEDPEVQDIDTGSLTVKMQRAIPLLLSGMQHGHVAKAVGVNINTISMWIHRHPAFQAEYERQRVGLYTADLQYARRRLREHLDNPSEKTQQGAARIILEHHAQMARAGTQHANTAILEKLLETITAVPADVADAKYREIAATAEVPHLSISNGDTVEGDIKE